MINTPVVRINSLLALLGAVGLAVSGGVLHQLVGQLREHRGIVENRDSIVTRVDRLFRDLQATEKEREALFTIRPSPENLVRFVEGLEGSAAAAFVDQKIAAVPPDIDKGGQPYASPVVRYRLTLQGTGEKIETHLRHLASLPELVRVERLELRTEPGGHVLTNTSAELTIAVAVRQSK